MDIKRLENYCQEFYKEDIDKFGLSITWKNIILYCKEYGETAFLSVDNFSELYELGLSIEDKENKKKMGKYYTPMDVSNLLVSWFINLEGYNICDVACGTGRLILSYLEKFDSDIVRTLILDGRLYLYDIDITAIDICINSICLRYGYDLEKYINKVNNDFLDFRVNLPENCKVISNPPYGKIEYYECSWEVTDVMKESKDLYACFMEKIVNQSKSSVIITPYSFTCSNKFGSLRSELSKLGGFILSFDNIPACIFKGEKKGVFNTNKANSTRASITVVDNKKKGFRLSPLIRFRAEDREQILDKCYLESLLGNVYQGVEELEKNISFYKCFAELEDTYKKWEEVSDMKLCDLLSDEPNNYLVCIPNSCRYFTVGSSYELDRSGKYNLYAKDEDSYYFLYAYMNSSFPYWYWRMYDGGVLYPKSLLLKNPIFMNRLDKFQFDFIKKYVESMKFEEKNCVVKKLNAGKEQESLKFPKKDRDFINSIFLSVIGSDLKNIDLDILHKNTVV